MTLGGYISIYLTHTILMENPLATLENTGQNQSLDHPYRVLGISAQTRKWSCEFFTGNIRNLNTRIAYLIA